MPRAWGCLRLCYSIVYYIIDVYVYVCMYVCMCVYIYIYIYICIHIYIYIERERERCLQLLLSTAVHVNGCSFQSLADLHLKEDAGASGVCEMNTRVC